MLRKYNKRRTSPDQSGDIVADQKAEMPILLITRIMAPLAGILRYYAKSQSRDKRQGKKPAEQQTMVYPCPQGDDQQGCGKHRYNNRQQSAGEEQPGLFSDYIFGRPVQSGVQVNNFEKSTSIHRFLISCHNIFRIRNQFLRISRSIDLSTTGFPDSRQRARCYSTLVQLRCLTMTAVPLERGISGEKRTGEHNVRP